MPEWTDAQLKTIETRNRNILVSAAAGSGKTSVLVERIKQLVITDKTDIDRFLITTFTDAAASEMKERLERAVNSELENPRADRKFLTRQLRLLPSAGISTFHSFCIGIIRRYFYLTDLEPGFGICDEVQAAIMKDKAVNALFEKRFEEDYERFTAFLIKYSSDRNDNRIKTEIKSLYDSLRSIPHYMDWASDKIGRMNTENPCREIGLTALMGKIVAGSLAKAYKCFKDAAEMLNDPSTEKIHSKAMADAEKLQYVYEIASEDYERNPERTEVIDFVSSPSYERMNVSKDEKDAYEDVKEPVTALRKKGKDYVTNLKNSYFSRSMEDFEEELRLNYGDTSYLLELIGEYEELYRSKKHETGVIDYDDVMHYAIGILQNEEAAAELRERFKYIFIDEYQDSNMLQEEIVAGIARDDNLFMVGDVKQSIYKFRLAEPELFMKRARSYRDESVGNSLVIDLNSNFRSKKNITDAVNRVFEQVMDDYHEDAALHCSIDERFPGYKTGIHIIDRGEVKNADIERVDAEAEIAAEIIRDALGTEIYDAKAQKSRNVQFRDIAVLSRGKAEVRDIERYLNNEGIPAYGETGEGYYESVEIQVFLNMLRIIDNMQNDIPLISVMRSVFFGFDVKEMVEIRKENRRGSFYSAVKEYAAGGKNSVVRNKIRNMLEEIALWKEKSRSLPLDELVRMVMYDTGYYDYCSGLPVGNKRISNLRMLIDKAAHFEETSHSGLFGFLGYVEAMKESKSSEAEAKIIGEGEDVVRVMTVHKSKGLEFPVVILTGAGKETGRGDRSYIPMHKDLGIGLPFINKNEKWRRKTILQKVIVDRKAEENLEEEIRILYVALTRAMDRLEIIGTVSSTEKLPDIPEKGSYMEMVYPSLKDMDSVDVHFHTDGEEFEGSGNMHRRRSILHLSKGEIERAASDVNAMKELSLRLGYIYPYESQTKVRAKYSVSQLNRKDDVLSGQPDLYEFNPEGIKEISAAKAGEVMHLVMEKIDYVRAYSQRKDYITDFCDELVSEGELSEEERMAVNTDEIAAFFESDTGRRAAEASGRGNLFREEEFIFEKNIEGVPAVVQGIIDCRFTENGEIILIDFKNSQLDEYRTEDDIREEYQQQIHLYRDALEAGTGLKVTESYIYLFKLKKFIKIS